MDLPKKRSSRYLAGVYAVFIMLFAFTVALFYTSRCQKSSRLTKQQAENIEEKNSDGTTPSKSGQTISPGNQSANKIEVSKSDYDTDNENNKVSSPQKASGGNNIKIDKNKANSDKVAIHKDNQIQNRPPSNSSGQNTIIHFSGESTGLTDPALNKLRTIYLFLLEYPDEEIIVEGYGDSNKANRPNINLSKLRANIVKDYFAKRGISKLRIKAFWMGSRKPAEDNDSRQENNKTHQVEIKFKYRSREWSE